MNKSDKKIARLLISETLFSFIVVFLILSLIIFGNQFFLVLSRSLTEGFLGSELFPLIILKYTRDLPFIVSFGFCLALIHALSKMYKSSEIVILNNAGVGDFKLFRMISPLVFFMTLFVIFLSIFLTAEVNKKVDLLKENASLRPDYIFFKEGVFQNFHNENMTLYTSEIDTLANDEGQLLKNVFIFLEEKYKVITSTTGEKKIDKVSGKVYLSLQDGKIYQNLDRNLLENISITTFKKFEILIFDPSKAQKINRIETFESKSFAELLKIFDLSSFKEIFYRFSIPLSFLIMCFLSIQFSKVDPRKTRNFALGYGLLTYISYYNILLFSKEMKTDSLVEIIIIFLITHAIYLTLVFIINYARNNLHQNSIKLNL